MAISLKHAFQSQLADGPDASVVRPSNWDAEHALLAATNTLLGRASAGTGAVEEIICTAAGRAILDDADATAQRTTLGAAATSHTHAQSDITNLVSDLAAKATTAYVNTQDALNVLKAGDTMTGALVAPSFATPINDNAFVKVSHTSYNAGVDPYQFISNAITRYKIDLLGRLYLNPASGNTVPHDINYAASITKDAGFGGVIVKSAQAGAASSGAFFTADQAGTGVVFYVGYGGGIYSTYGSVSVISDIAYKEDVRPLPYGLAEIMRLNPLMYRLRKEGAEMPKHFGFSAQDVQQVFPELVTESAPMAEQGKQPPLVLAESSIIVPLVAAVQDLAQKCQALNARVKALEAAVP